MRRLAALALLTTAAACSPTQQGAVVVNTPSKVAETVQQGAVCRIGPDGGPALADRGIGGTGAPLLAQTGGTHPAPTRLAADRGIGGTGVVGVITGFASVCVDGLEVSYDTSAPVDIDGTPAATADLRVGQVVAIEAQGTPTAPTATRISVRRDVTGRVEGVALDTGIVTVAGQPVAIPAGTPNADRVGLGDWVSVSGLRRPDGTFVASRLDPAAAGAFLVRGPVSQQNGSLLVGALKISANTVSLGTGQYVVVSGKYDAGRPNVANVSPDAASGDPTAYFGPSVHHLVVQGFVRMTHGMVALNGLTATAGPGLPSRARSDTIAILSLERKPDGGFAAVELRYADGATGPAAAARPASKAQPPVPSRLAPAEQSAPPINAASGMAVMPQVPNPADAAAGMSAMGNAPALPTVTAPPTTGQPPVSGAVQAGSTGPSTSSPAATAGPLGTTTPPSPSLPATVTTVPPTPAPVSNPTATTQGLQISQTQVTAKPTWASLPVSAVQPATGALAATRAASAPLLSTITAALTTAPAQASSVKPAASSVVHHGGATNSIVTPVVSSAVTHRAQ